MDANLSRLISLRISNKDYVQLEQTAEHLGLKPAVLARMLVRVGLSAPKEKSRRHSQHELDVAFKKLECTVVSSDVSHIDPVELINRMRNERAQEILSNPPRSAE